MKFIKLIVISVILLFAMASGIGLLFPSTVVVSRAVDITAPKDSLYRYIKDLNGWKRWIDGLNDTSVVVTNPHQGILGHTAVTITENAKNYAVTSEWKGLKGQSVQTSSMNLYQDSAQTKTVVQWQFNQQIKWYPWERFSSMMNDKIMGTMMEKNLNNLKTLIEQAAPVNTGN